MKITTNDKYIIFGVLGLTAVIFAISKRKAIGAKIESINSFVDKVKNTAFNEYDIWKKGNIKEGDKSTMDRLRAY
jgi:hypothetical protein